MLTINWKGKIGYGDIISPICYAHNVAYKLHTKVKLVFHWNHGSSFKVNEADPETLMQRADYIYGKCVGSNVEMIHRYHSSLPKTFNHDNYAFADDLHNFWYCQERNIGWASDIIVNGTHHNALSMDQYGKKWKDPVGAEGWLQLKENLSKSYHVHDVSYRTPTKELFKQMRLLLLSFRKRVLVRVLLIRLLLFYLYNLVRLLVRRLWLFFLLLRVLVSLNSCRRCCVQMMFILLTMVVVKHQY